MHPMHSPRAVLHAEEISATHRTLFAALDALLEARDAETARAALELLRGTLPHHFTLEEEPDGLFQWIGALRPGRRGEVRALEADHRLLLEQAGVLRSPFDAEGEVDEAAAGDIADFDRHMRAHERREHALLAEALAT